MLVLEPESFANAGERDRWYDNRKQQVSAKWKKAIQELETRCADDPGDLDCPANLKAAKEKRDAELEKLERHRQEAKLPN